MKLALVVFIIFYMFQATYASDLSKDLDSLGADKAILKRARALDPKNRLRVVQKGKLIGIGVLSLVPTIQWLKVVTHS